jgi:tetratricopeptide (TPR) repeat protein
VAFGPRHRLVAGSLLFIADLLAAQDRPSEAMPLVERAQAILVTGDDRVAQAEALRVAAEVHRSSGHLVEARDEAHRARTLLIEALGADRAAPEIARALDEEGSALTALGQPGPAVALEEQALAIFERSLPADDDEIADCLARLGDAHLAAGDPGKAAAALERARAILEHGDRDPAAVAKVARELSRARREQARPATPR